MSSREYVIGLLLGTEEDWPAAYEALVARLGTVDGHTLCTERILNEPFDLRYVPRYSLVIDRLAWWYDLPREWLKKIALMDEVYLLNNPFTFQAMEKHSAYCALMRLGIRVPDTWLIPHKVPPTNERFERGGPVLLGAEEESDRVFSHPRSQEPREMVRDLALP